MVKGSKMRLLAVILALCLSGAVLFGPVPFAVSAVWADDGGDDSDDDDERDDDDDDEDGDGDDDDDSFVRAQNRQEVTGGAAPAVRSPQQMPRPAQASPPRRYAPAGAAPRQPAPPAKSAVPQPFAARALSADLPRLDFGPTAGDRHRRGEISATGLTPQNIEVLRQAGFEILRRGDLTALGQGEAARLRSPAGMEIGAALATARGLVPGGVFDLSHLYDPSAGDYGRRIIGMPVGRACLEGGRIGMIDGAIGAHPALEGLALTHKDFSGQEAGRLHGTAVLSILAGAPPGSARAVAGTDVFVASVFAPDGAGMSADVIDLAAAISWQVGHDVPVVNMSLAGPDNAVLAQAVRGAAAAGTLIVAAAGNGGPLGGPRYPAAYEEVIAVAAVDARGRAYQHNSRGDYVDVAAPGVDVWGAHVQSGGAAMWSGTSFAAPFVSLELAAARDGAWTPRAARRYLARHARDLGAPGHDPQFGAGLIQARACGG